MHALKQLTAAFVIGTMALPMAQAQKAPKSQSVVLAPASSLSGAKPKEITEIENTVEAGLGTVPMVKVVGAKAASASANKAKRPELRSCEGDAKCLAALGALVSVQYTVYAEVGGLGDAQVVYLKLVDVATATEIRSTTIELSSSSDAKAASAAAAARLLAPDSYIGTVNVTTPVKGAIVYVDGQKRGTTPTGPISAPVGSHALRVTHPEHRDYVRFVDIEFGKATAINAELQPLPGVSQRLSREGIIDGGVAGGSIKYNETPWYFRWYTITGGAAAVAITSALIFGAVRDDINPSAIKDL
jgi:hypothetical protein